MKVDLNKIFCIHRYNVSQTSDSFKCITEKNELYSWFNFKCVKCGKEKNRIKPIKIIRRYH